MSQPIFKPRTFNGDLAHLPHALAAAHPLETLGGVALAIPHQQGRQVKWTKPPYQIACPTPSSESKRREHLGEI